MTKTVLKLKFYYKMKYELQEPDCFEVQRRWRERPKIKMLEKMLFILVSILKTVKRLTKANKNIWQKNIDNRTWQRPLIHQLQGERIELRSIKLGSFKQIADFDNRRCQSVERTYRILS